MPTDDELRLRDPAKLPYKEMPELVVGVIHQRVFEAFWENGHVVMDNVLNELYRAVRILYNKGQSCTMDSIYKHTVLHKQWG